MFACGHVFHPFLTFGIQSANQFPRPLQDFCGVLLRGSGLSQITPIWCPVSSSCAGFLP